MTPVLPPPQPPEPLGLRSLLGFDPLSPLLAIIPFIAIVGTSLSWHPGALVLLLVAPMLPLAQARRGSASLLGLAVFVLLLTLGIAAASSAPTIPLTDDPSALPPLPWFAAEQWNIAFNTSARIGAIIALLLFAGLLSAPEDTVRAFVIHLKMPNRIGQAGITALGFLPALRREHRSILEAHLLRGSRLDLPLLETPVRWARSAPALIAAAVRRAERTAMSMDARAFGAFPTRTERSALSWRPRDTALVLLALLLAAVLLHQSWDTGFAVTPNRL